MARYVIMPEAIDDSFIAVMVEELLSGDTAQAQGRPGADDDTAYGEALPEDDTAMGVEALDEEVGVGDQAWESAAKGRGAEGPAGPAVEPRPAPVPRAKRPVHRAQWRLRIFEEESNVEHVVRLGDRPVTIGRSRENSVVIQCSRVSRRHLRLWLDESGPNVENLAEHNRMRVNGRKLQKAHLEANDVIRIGLVKISLERADDGGGSASEST